MNIETKNTQPTVSKRELWLSHVEKWKESRLSQEAYCRQAGINYGTFVHWRGVLRSESPEVNQKKFATVKIAASTQLSADAPRAIQIKLLSGHIVYIPTTMGIKEIATLIQALGYANA